MKSFIYSMVSLALVASAYADIQCWQCTEAMGTSANAPLDCRSDANEYYGEIVTCTATSSTLNPDVCWKTQNVDTKMTWRDCAPAQGDSNVSPWDDAYATKNRCKKVNGIRQCTCKEAMCNSGFNVESSVIVMSVTAVASLVFGRM